MCGSVKRSFKKSKILNHHLSLTVTDAQERAGYLKLSDLINDTLQKAFLSSFCIDLEWIETLLPKNKNVVFATSKRGLAEASGVVLGVSLQGTRS